MRCLCFLRLDSTAGAQAIRPKSTQIAIPFARVSKSGALTTTRGRRRRSSRGHVRCSRESSGPPENPIAELDMMLANPLAYRHLPQVAWAFDPSLGGCRQVRWADPGEPRAVRRTALAVARLEAIGRQWELN